MDDIKFVCKRCGYSFGKHDTKYILPQETVDRLWIKGYLRSDGCNEICEDCFNEIAMLDYKPKKA